MKLGELRGAIRKTKGNPWFECYPFPGTDKAFRFYLQKTPLLEELEKVYPGGKATDTELDYDAETGQLKPIGASFEKAPAGTVMVPADDDPAPIITDGTVISSTDLDDLLDF